MEARTMKDIQHMCTKHPLPNSRWIMKLSFRKIKSMLSSCLCHCEEVCQLKLCRHIVNSNNNIILHLCPGVRDINANMLCEPILQWIMSYADSIHCQTKKGIGTRTDTPKSSSNLCCHKSHSSYSASALEWEIVVCFLVFHALRKHHQEKHSRQKESGDRSSH